VPCSFTVPGSDTGALPAAALVAVPDAESEPEPEPDPDAVVVPLLELGLLSPPHAAITSKRAIAPAPTPNRSRPITASSRHRPRDLRAGRVSGLPAPLGAAVRGRGQLLAVLTERSETEAKPRHQNVLIITCFSSVYASMA
jgi:hypothetical protein